MRQRSHVQLTHAVSIDGLPAGRKEMSHDHKGNLPADCGAHVFRSSANLVIVIRVVIS
jgi:hypothetical protein